MNTTDKTTSEIFAAHFNIGNGLVGGQRFDVNLLICQRDKSIVGKGHLFQSVNPPLNVFTDLNGTFNYQCTMSSCHIMMNLQGYQPYPGIPPVGTDLHNVTLRILLDEDWKTGVAFYSYKNESGEWIEAENQPVTLANSAPIKSIEQFEFAPQELTKA
ncbi:DUF1842 domain-containing protein [Vibrio ostreicida]|uniref:DUF1842 domain-containing protein n=1 Tax=Vibrio ostreicida TaxID=526588 RepID=UPI00097108C6|nr:DUF1842 domain-containing protein [Vibrio ostreicida]